MLNLISFVGIDTQTDIDNLIELQENSDHILEFGVLYSKGRAGTKRYPAHDDCQVLLDTLYGTELHSSLHLCGDEAIEGFFAQDSEYVDLAEMADRIQLNFNLKNFHDAYLIDKILELSTKYSLIIQSNKTKADLVSKLVNECVMYGTNQSNSNLNLLYDGSGGFGRVILDIKPAYQNHFTGYAGGINPLNVAEIVTKIDKVNGNEKYYIDMESGVRTDDWFSTQLCRQVIDNLKA